ncbi:hypothetical protein Q1695_013096 [Nippostrongylus brasiliensis]|nr:hypothetical protein Q1695_013096 [Nippostrongylus brasiliensis]
MFYYPEASLPQLSRGRNNMRPMSSLSSGSSTEYVLPPPPTTSLPPPASSRPPSPGLQITQLLHQTANLLAVNAQLRKEIEQCGPSTVLAKLATSHLTSKIVVVDVFSRSPEPQPSV